MGHDKAAMKLLGYTPLQPDPAPMPVSQPDVSRLQPIPIARLEQAMEAMLQATIGGSQIGWGYADNNRFANMRMIAYFLYTGEFPSEATVGDLARRLKDEPPVYG